MNHLGISFDAFISKHFLLSVLWHEPLNYLKTKCAIGTPRHVAKGQKGGCCPLVLLPWPNCTPVSATLWPLVSSPLACPVPIASQLLVSELHCASLLLVFCQCCCLCCSVQFTNLFQSAEKRIANCRAWEVCCDTLKYIIDFKRWMYLCLLLRWINVVSTALGFLVYFINSAGLVGFITFAINLAGFESPGKVYKKSPGRVYNPCMTSCEE